MPTYPAFNGQINEEDDCGYLNGYVAGIAGSLHGEHRSSSIANSSKIRLSEASGSLVEEEELSADESSLSLPPFSTFALANVKEELNTATSCGDDIVEEKGSRQIEFQGTDDDSVFSPKSRSSTASFGDFQQEQRSREDSASSGESFGDFDETKPRSSSAEAGDEENLRSDCDLNGVVNDVRCLCFNSDSTIQTSSPPTGTSSILNRNFVWKHVRNNVTKPSYTWEQLKLYSYLLGALRVRKPISLNRLKSNLEKKKKLVKRTCHSTTDNSSYSVTDGEFTDCSISMVTSEQLDSVSMVTADLDNVNHETLSEISEVSNGTIRSDGDKGCCRPCVPAVIQRRFISHRRVNSSPASVFSVSNSIPSLCTSETRSLTGSPGIFKRVVKAVSTDSDGSSLFDENHAEQRLSALQTEDLLTMHQEMKERVSELSATLIKEFMFRGDADHSCEVKKAFISALRLTEEKKSKNQISTKFINMLPLEWKGVCPSTEILVLLTQLLNGIVGESTHTTKLMSHYKVVVNKVC